MEYLSLRGKIAVVTGSASGIGAATAKRLAKCGVVLSLIDVNNVGLNNVAVKCAQLAHEFNNPKPFVFIGDLTEDAIRQEYVDSTVKHFGRLDILVNNAGIAIQSSMFDPTMEMADKLFSILLRATYDMCRLSTKYLIASKGCIINIASVCGIQTCFVNPALNTSKAGIIHLTRCIADELGSHNVRANSISPGPINTNLGKGYLGDNVCNNITNINFEKEVKIHLNQFQQKIGQNVCAMGRCGKTEEVVNVVVFLASGESSYVSGSNVVVDGAMLAKSVIKLPQSK